MMNQNQIEKHSVAQSITLHLLPGILIGVFYFSILQPVQTLGYPSIFALTLAVVFVLIPVELGYLLYQGKQKTGRFSLKGVIHYRDSIPWWQYLVWVPVVFVAIAIIFTLLKPLETLLREEVFFWMPAPSAGLDGSYSKNSLIITYLMMFVFVAVLGPLVEELYFRGYLLPRMKGRFVALVHSLLFAAYHVFTPWMIISRALGLLPLIYAVRKKNIYVGIVVHILVNMLDVVTGVLFIANLP